MGHNQTLQFCTDLVEPVVDGFQRRRDILGVFVRLDFLRDLETFFEE